MINITTKEAIMSAVHLLDAALRELKLKNDNALARELEVGPPVISKLRRHHMVPGPSFILRLHEVAPELFPVSRIRELLLEAV